MVIGLRLNSKWSCAPTTTGAALSMQPRPRGGLGARARSSAAALSPALVEIGDGDRGDVDGVLLVVVLDVEDDGGSCNVLGPRWLESRTTTWTTTATARWLAILGARASGCSISRTADVGAQRGLNCFGFRLNNQPKMPMISGGRRAELGGDDPTINLFDGDEGAADFRRRR